MEGRNEILFKRSSNCGDECYSEESDHFRYLLGIIKLKKLWTRSMSLRGNYVENKNGLDL